MPEGIVINSLDDRVIQWIGVKFEDAASQQRRFIDCRPRSDFTAGTIPGAISVTQEDVMLLAVMGNNHAEEDDSTANLGAEGMRLHQQLLPLLKGADAMLVLFGQDGGSMGREDDLLVMNILSNQMHVPLARMARLRGGIDAWAYSGQELQRPASKNSAPPPDSLGAFLTQVSLEHLVPLLSNTTLEDLITLHGNGRARLLATMQQCGAKLTDRQALANAVGKALREGRISSHGTTLGTSHAAQPKSKETPDSVWQATLSPFEYKVLRLKGTEPCGGEYDAFYPSEGHFACRGCGKPLYSSAAKFKSGCGWPAFDRCFVGSVECTADITHGMRRIEITCARVRAAPATWVMSSQASTSRLQMSGTA